MSNAADKSAEITAIGNKWSDLKDSFTAEFGDKCWYTEVPRVGTDNSVDHFRPKGGAKMKNGKTASKIINGTTEKHSGYWWLAYEISNYRYSCTYANRVTGFGGKGDFFPLEIEADRAWIHTDNLGLEDVTLLDPCVVADVECIEFDHIPGEAVAAHTKINNPEAFSRFEESRKYYNLNEGSISTARQRVMAAVKKDLELLELVWNLPAANRIPLDPAITRAVASLVSACDRKSQFSAAAVSLVKIRKAEAWMADVVAQADLSP